MMEYAAPSWCLFKSVSLHLQKKTFADIDPQINKVKRRRDKNEIARTRLQNLNHLKSSKQTCVQNNKKICLHFRLDVHHGRMRKKIHAIQEETCRKQFAKKERKKKRKTQR
jgi:hypothetical protein